MNLTRAIGDYLDGLAGTRLAMRSPSVFAPFAAFAAIQWGVLFLLGWFMMPPVAPFMVPVVARLGGEEALHYPMHLVLMPGMFRAIYLPLVATLGFALWSAAVWMMVGHHVVGRTRDGAPFARSLPQLLVLGVCFVGVSTGIGEGVARAAAGIETPMVQRGVIILGMLATALAQALMVYAPVALRLHGGGAWTALRDSAAFARRNYVATLLVVGTVLLLHVPLDFILAQAHRVAFRFRPETVFHLLVVSAAVEMFTAYLLFAATTALALREDGGMR